MLGPSTVEGPRIMRPVSTEQGRMSNMVVLGTQGRAQLCNSCPVCASKLDAGSAE
jgi:hypothetical protein